MTLTQKQRIEELYRAAGLQFDGDWENWPLPLLEHIVAAGRATKEFDLGALAALRKGAGY